MDQPLTTPELLQTVQKLARKYRGYTEKEDLIQEGCLAYYKALDKGETDINRLQTEMRKAMSRYANLKDRTVALPDSESNWFLRKELAPEEYKNLSSSQKSFYDAYRGGSTSTEVIEELFSESPLTVEQRLSLKQGFEGMSEKHKKAVVYCTILGLTQNQTADKLKVSRQRVQQILREAQEKLTAALI